MLHAPRAILQLRDALVYFAHHRHRRSSLIFFLYELYRGGGFSPRDSRDHKCRRVGRVGYFDMRFGRFTQDFVHVSLEITTSPTSRQRGEESRSLARSRLAFRSTRKSDYGRGRARPSFSKAISPRRGDARRWIFLEGENALRQGATCKYDSLTWRDVNICSWLKVCAQSWDNWITHSNNLLKCVLSFVYKLKIFFLFA